MAEGSFKGLLVWQQGMDLVQQVYLATEGFPKTEEYGLKTQIRRSAISIPSNIAEGSGRGTKKDFVAFLKIARGSLRELETQIEIGVRLNYLGESAAAELGNLITSVAILLSRLIKSQTDGEGS